MNERFEQELKQWGCESNFKKPSQEQAEQYCRSLAQSHYENFPIATYLLARSVRQHFYNIYAYCRWADDLGDEVGESCRALKLLGWWRDELNRCYQGEASHPVFVALQDTIQKFQIPIEPFDQLIQAFEQDQTVIRYDTFEQLLDYCSRSANPVGRLVLYLCESHQEENLKMSDSVCTGLQLANFWQDVHRDFLIDRVYLPQEDVERFGYSNEMIGSKIENDAFLKLMKFQVERARSFLVAGQPLATRLPGRMQFDVDLFVRGGLAILDKIEKQNYRVLQSRPVLSKFDFVKLATKSFVKSLVPNWLSGQTTQQVSQQGTQQEIGQSEERE